MTKADVEAWAEANGRDALEVALGVLASQSSVILPMTVTARDEEGQALRVEVYKGHLAARRAAEVDAETRLHGALREAAEA